MNHVEAKWRLLRELVKYRRLSYDKLRAMIGESRYVDAIGPSGAAYQVDIDIVWDDKPGGAIRILAAIDDGGWRAFCPVGYDDLRTPPVA